MDLRQGTPIAGPPSHVAGLVASARRLFESRRYAEAGAYLSDALALDPDLPLPHYYMGRLREIQGDNEEALVHFQSALTLDPSLKSARQHMAVLLVRLGRRDESLPLWHAELSGNGRSLVWIQTLIRNAMCSRDLTLAGQYAEIAAQFRWGWSSPAMETWQFNFHNPPSIPLSIPKLCHDVQQFQYLRGKGILGNEFVPVIDAYQNIIDSLASRGSDVRVPIGGKEHSDIRHVYNRLIHLSPAVRVKRALSNTWDAAIIERQYIDNLPGIAVVDDFLSNEALEGLRKFCLESTVWFHNRYAHGRLGAFFQDGFNCPLLLQIAEELRDALPRVIGNRYPLRQVWGFKNVQPLPAGVTTHADFAAVNVNFWITPEDANLDQTTGGLVIYDVDAPMHWDFDTYNGSDMIKPFLRRQASAAVTIPYRQNRAIIFNSDLFHATAAVSFRPGYENHRINVTMLYGDREDDVHHRQLGKPDRTNGLVSAWRPASIAGLRKARR
ncbi:tetratricopeptide repeat protein [Paraburkholderia strydomiana]|uniref:Tetratricopeptide repeat protein n=1 Tax=Paraburkholderia strydomiana TaxID=1245417 RepID=A0ABW9BY92_9BURK